MSFKSILCFIACTITITIACKYEQVNLRMHSESEEKLAASKNESVKVYELLHKVHISNFYDA
jgi:hypothetical protein